MIKKYGIFYEDSLLESIHTYESREKAEIALARMSYFASQALTPNKEYIDKLKNCKITEVPCQID